MLLCGTDNIRDVIAFPKTTQASCLMTDAPSPVNPDLAISIEKQLAKQGEGE
ncbi:hypothetical protein [Pseudoalteromonas sp. CO348]|uniref:hypothetical protein n=1 Tax=Pseudoalteromonas sp. CO348 TaxID=1777271 RepID=UPI0013EE5BB6|nr:hypothetical protein [Pseudoalteromonas sp. CO348]